MKPEEGLETAKDDYMIRIRIKGDYKKADRYFERLLEIIHFGELDKWGKAGVEELRRMTPKDTGKTSESWSYNIRREGKNVYLEWINDNTNGHINIAIILQYGHGTRNGGYVQGRDYINPAILPVFDDICREITEEIRRQ